MTAAPDTRRPLFFWVVVLACVLFAIVFSTTVDVYIRYSGPLKALSEADEMEDAEVVAAKRKPAKKEA